MYVRYGSLAAALPPEAAITLELPKMAANDPKRTLFLPPTSYISAFS